MGKTNQLWDGALHIKALTFDVTFYCRRCYGMATSKTCPHDPKDQISISGTQQRQMLSTDAGIPTEFSRPEVVAILREYYATDRTTYKNDLGWSAPPPRHQPK
jgi:sulfate adenylyltransferase